MSRIDKVIIHIIDTFILAFVLSITAAIAVMTLVYIGSDDLMKDHILSMADMGRQPVVEWETRSVYRG